MHPNASPTFPHDLNLNPIDRIKHSFSSLPSQIKHLHIAFSGGLDSYVLLHLTHQLFPHYPLSAIHVNHGLQPQSLHWEQTVQSICDTLHIPCLTYRVHDNITHYKKAGHSPEEAARNARYDALTQALSYKDCLLTGHHLEDQAETLILNLMRGAGIEGLGSMPLLTPRNTTFHFRPLLSWTYKERLTYAKQNKLTWIEDPSNNNKRFLRNFVRHTILPTLQTRWPNPTLQLTRAASHCLNASQLSNEIATQDLMMAATNPHQLSIPCLLSLSPLRRSNALRYWLKRQLTKPLSTVQFIRVERLLYKTPKSNPCCTVHNHIIKRYQDHLYLLPVHLPSLQSPKPSKPTKPTKHDILWNHQNPIKLSNHTLTATPSQGQGIKASLLKTAPLTIRYRQGGERFHPNNRVGSHPLKKLFQEWRILPWERDRWPLIYHNNALIMVPGYAVSKDSAAVSHEPGLIITIS